MRKHVLKLGVFLLMVLNIICLAGVFSPAAAQIQHVLILPFKINAPQDATYLQQGILDMRASRLEWPEKVEVVSNAQAWNAYHKVNGKIDQGNAIILAQDSEADYVLFGSVTVVGKNVSMDARMIDLRGIKPPMTVISQAEGLDGVIPKVNEFAEEVNQKCFGRSSATANAKPTPETQPEEPLPAYRRHPDYLLTGQEGRHLSPLNPNFVAAVGGDEREGAFWRSPSFKIHIVGLDVGDVDGDGLNEIVYATTNELYVTRIVNGVLRKITKYSGVTTDRFLSVDLADLNGNGIPEIFVSIQRNYRANSMVFEFKNGKMLPIVQDSDWYYRVVDLPQGPTLLGQKSGPVLAFYGGIKELQYSGGQYTPLKNVKTSKDIFLFNFAISNLTDTANEHIIYIDKDDHLTVKTQGGEELWTSRERFAGTTNYLEEKHANDQYTDGDTRGEGPKKLYVPTRILIADLDEDGVKEVLVARNEGGVGSKWLTRFRNYKRGSILSLGFNQMSMHENWRSKEVPGGFTDYQIADFDNNGVPDLVGALALRGGQLATSFRSTIVAYELASPSEMREAQTKRTQQ